MVPFPIPFMSSRFIAPLSTFSALALLLTQSGGTVHAQLTPLAQTAQVYQPVNVPSYDAYIQCEVRAVQERDSALSQLYRQYGDTLAQHFSQRGQALAAAWQQYDPDTNRYPDRDIERQYRERERDIDRALRDAEREITSRFRDAERECSDIRSEIRRQIRDAEREQRRRENGGSSSSVYGGTWPTTPVIPSNTTWTYGRVVNPTCCPW